MVSKTKTKKNNTLKSNKPTVTNLFYFFFGFIALLFPVIHYNATLDIVMMPRLYGISLLIVVVGLAMLIWGKKLGYDYGFIQNKIYWMFIAWIGFSIFSLFLSSNPIEGIFDVLKTMYLPIMVSFTVLMLISESDSLSKLTKLFVVSALILTSIAFYQYVTGVLLSSETIFDEYGRQTPIIYKVRGFMAHKNLLSIAFALLLPFSLFGIYSCRRLWRYLSIVSAILLLAFMVILRTRAVWVGTMASVGVLVLILMFLGNRFGIGKRIQNAIIVTGIVGLLSVVGVLFLSQGNSQNPYVKQLQSIVNPKSQQNIHRINIWKTTLDMIQEKPLFGYGPGNWKLHAPKFHNGRFTRESELNWQRPHNDYLWVLAEKGLIGLLIYLGIFTMIFYFLIYVIRKSEEYHERLLSIFLVIGLTIYLAASFFDFPYERIYHHVLLSVIFGVSIYLFSRNVVVKPTSLSPMFFLVPVLIAGFGVVYAGQCVNQEVHLRIARDHTNYMNTQAQMGNALNAKTIQYHWKQVLLNAELAQKPLKNLDPQANPINSYAGLAYVNLGQFAKGIEVLLKAHEQHPSNINVLNNIGAAYFKVDKFEEALKYLKLSYEIFPSNDAVTNLSAVYFKLNMYQEAYETIMSFPEEERSDIMKNNLNAIKRLLDKEKQRESDTN